MVTRYRFFLSLVALCCWASLTMGQTINEVRIDQTGTDNDEYFELIGTPGASLDNVYYVVIGDGAGGSGTVESVTDLTGNLINGAGFFTVSEGSFGMGTITGIVDLMVGTGLNFENSDNVTHLLVTGFTGAVDDDIDTNDDGVIDNMLWATELDSIALLESVGTGDLVYSANTVGPDGNFVPSQIFRCPDGTGSWEIGIFDIVGSTPTDTPGDLNNCMACNPPTGLSCDSDCMTGDITLSWTNPIAYTQVEVFRDGVSLVVLTMGEEMYVDPAVTTGMTYTYEVVGTCGPMMTGLSTCVQDHCLCMPPTGLGCVSDCMADTVTLTWTNGDTYTGIEILRDGASIAVLGGMDTMYVDNGVPVGPRTYTIVGTCGPDAADASCGVLHCVTPPDVEFSEVRINTPGGDDEEEFVELFGAPGTSLDGLTFLAIGDSFTGLSGVVEEAVSFTGFSLDADGYFVLAQSDLDDQTDPLNATACVNYLGVGAGPDLILPTLNLENSDNITYLLVSDFTGALGDDLDTDNDGAFDTIPWSSIVAELGILATIGSGDQLYSTNTVGPWAANPSGQPDHVYLCVGGLGNQDDWRLGSLFGCPAIDTPGAANTCPGCFEIVNLTCTSDCVTGDVTLNWTNDDNYTNIIVFRDGSQIAILPGTDQSYVDMAAPAGFFTYEVVGDCGMAGFTTATSCELINGVYSGEDHVVFVGEGQGGMVDSANTLKSALEANGETAILISELATYPCLGQLTQSVVLWVCNGTFPEKYVMTVDDGQVLADRVANGSSVYVEGAGTFVFDPATPFDSYDGIDDSIRMEGVTGLADDSLTSLDGSAFSDIDFSALQDAIYNQDNGGGNDFNDTLLATGTVAPLDIPGGSAGVIWSNNPDMMPDPVVEAAYAVALYYDSPDAFGDVIVSTFEFGGLGAPADFQAVALAYTDALEQAVVPTDDFDRGDCNNDSTRNIADAIFLLGFLFPNGPPVSLACQDACDTNDDGALNIADAISLLGNLFPQGPPTPLPDPFGACGPDPSMDSLDCTGYSHCP